MIRRFALLLALPTCGWACSCSGAWPSVKQAWERAPVVFLGTVEAADPDGDGMSFRQQVVRIRVEEAFKGVSAGELIRLHLGGTSCDASFRTGERAVFYMHRGANRQPYLPWCTRALGNPEPGGDDLLFLRGLPKSAIGTRLSGDVSEYGESHTRGFHRIAGIPNIKVTVSGPNGFRRELVTNAAGAYEIYGLPPGKYSVGIAVPSGLRIRFPTITTSPSVPDDDSAVRLETNGAAGVGFVLQADTRVAGRMLDAKGNPMRGVCIDLEPVESHGGNRSPFFSCSKEDGRFTMEMMPPGRYWVVARDDVEKGPFKSTSTLYYPGVRSRERSTVISIQANKYVENLVIQLPSEETRMNIGGRVRFLDLVPVAHATVTFRSPDHGYSETTSTSADGTFRLPLISGMRGQLDVQMTVLEPIVLRQCPEFGAGTRGRGLSRILAAAPMSLSIDSDREGLEFTIPSRSCKAWPGR